MKVFALCLLLAIPMAAEARPVTHRKPSSPQGSSEAARVALLIGAMKAAWGDQPVTCSDATWYFPHSNVAHVSTTCDMENIPDSPRGGFCDTNSGHAPSGKFDCWLTYQTEPDLNPNVFASEEYFLSPNGRFAAGHSND